ncbi:hypothetical protein MPTK1_4g18930 [Marchantia polymorpha subsp. ruderalis]|uniref:ATPase AAA-type core domain-containing protein n=2 Tax=Marchantia polymorpha TaxID=3197 RepID=A0AAF6BBE8_MARPO|nr:hypothetical protein MARPO_0164s0017 [Marchantia polymorpha]PTQ28424.1 hypothetical protein MARPO_0164s0017 [Marchantia polymorpha]BBN09331.1 hypothetical protein Mp_4g18930 [Marchantia polymorpha subsp. ruderalis]BBN09332.1 hypothetical protein Mp_4g18930 [Marchantia polymorpha subsp. ruderalis]|eukprot:PTQ28423.1 hypothetical protein MARPO_0164s0017 [Marchantia polymorpha]
MEGLGTRTDEARFVHGRESVAQQVSLSNVEAPQSDKLSVLDFLMSRPLSERPSLGPDTALLSGPHRCGKTSLLLQLAYNIAAQGSNFVVFICKPRNFDSDIYLTQDVDSSSEILDRIQIKYVHDDEELRKFFAAFHMHITLPTTLIVDDFLDFFQGCDTIQQTSRGLVIAKTLCLAHSAISYASEQYKTPASCRLILSDSHSGDGPRLSYIMKRWINQTFVIKAVHDTSTFTLELQSSPMGPQKENVVAKYVLSQNHLRFDGWDVLHRNH